MSNGSSSHVRVRIVSVLAALLVSAVMIRLLGLGVLAWKERSTVELTVALLVVMASFAASAWAEFGISRLVSNPAVAALASIGVRTGGVAFAVLVTVLSPWKSPSLLLLLAGLYLVALLVDTVTWALAIRRPPASSVVNQASDTQSN